MPARPTATDTGDFLVHVASQINASFQSSLVKKGGAAVALGDEQLRVHQGKDGDEDEERGELSNDMRRILRELQASRLQVRGLQQVVDELQEEQRLSQQRVALFGTLSSKLKRELVDERLALIDAKNEVNELRRSLRLEGEDAGGRSPQSPSLRDEDDNPWSSPNKPGVRGSVAGGNAAVSSGAASTGSKLLGFNFYPSASVSSRGQRDPGAADEDDDEPPSPSSSTQTLRSTLMGQFLPSSLLDSPQITPKHVKSFTSDDLSEDKASPPLPRLTDDMEALSLAMPSLPTRSSTGMTVGQAEPQQRKSEVVSGTEDGHDERKETSQSGSGTKASTISAASTSGSAVSALKLSMMAELFDSIPVEELESILKRFDGQEAAAIEHILHTHPSFNPAMATGSDSDLGGRGESGSSLAAMASPSPSRSSPSVGMGSHGKSNLHRSSSLSGLSGGPPPGSSSNWKTEICMYYMQGKCNKTRRTCSFAHGESDLVRPSATSGGGSGAKHGPHYKTRLCQAYENGTCPKSRRDCPMAHGVNDLRDGGSSSVVSGGGNQPMLATTAPRLQSYKTELCYYFLKGNCNYTKEECRFAHGQSDLRTLQHQAYDMAHQQQHQNPYLPPPGQYRYLKSMEDKRATSGARPPPPRRDSGSSWSSYDPPGLPPPEF
ncbi:hypothetical protein BBJ28_00022376 [Nothophytophthora sp. Chile5]|nr:hypothetical protein BBJ28_00022376 [Nothophytophthora sp. Chile5]